MPFGQTIFGNGSVSHSTSSSWSSTLFLGEVVVKSKSHSCGIGKSQRPMLVKFSNGFSCSCVLLCRIRCPCASNDICETAISPEEDGERSLASAATQPSPPTAPGESAYASATRMVVRNVKRGGGGGSAESTLAVNTRQTTATRNTVGTTDMMK